MALNTITKSKIMSYADTNIFTILNNRSYIADPKNRGANGKFVYRNDPWSKGQDYQSYPYMILRFPKIEKDNVSVDGAVKDFVWTHDVTVRTIIGGAVNNADNTSKGVTDMQDIIDDLHETFDDKTRKDELRLLKMYNLKLVTLDNDEFVDSNGKHVFVANLEISYNVRLSVA